MKLIDQDGHTVKMSVEEVAACLKDMGNPFGEYVLANEQICGGNTKGLRIKKSEVGNVSKWRLYLSHEIVLAFRSTKRPDELFWPWTLWRKKRMGSKLLDRKVMTPLINGVGGGYVDVKAEPVWLRLKGKEPVIVYVS